MRLNGSPNRCRVGDYGGIMLGAGDLVRAYSRCGSIALEASGVGFMREFTLCAVTLPYALYENVKRLLNACGAEITDEDFGAEVMLRFSLVSEGLPELENKITELTAGLVKVQAEGVSMGCNQPALLTCEGLKI
jgi:putative IMPACT (imprinted ancient) family translation regulator